MKDIFFVGKLNLENRELITALREHFSVQLVTEENSNLNDMMRFSVPALVIISLTEADSCYMKFFECLKSSWSGIPVITIGTTAETFAYRSFYFYSQFENFHRPVTDTELVDICMKKLNLSLELDVANMLREEKEHVLIVDDNVAQLRNIKQLLEDKYSVAVATSGAQAFVAMGKQKPDVILLDYMMPVMDGRMTLEMIRADEQLKDIPVIFLTSAADKEIVKELLSMKPAGYLLKPPSYDKLISTIENVLHAY